MVWKGFDRKHEMFVLIIFLLTIILSTRVLNIYGGSGLRLNGGPDVMKALIGWLVPDASLWLSPSLLYLRFSLAGTICES